MNHHDTSSCVCPQCPGTGCNCGCQEGAKREQQASAACHCATRCGCEGAEAGCLCSAPATQA